MTGMSRREWLRSRIPAALDLVARNLGARFEGGVEPRRRPPGAVAEASFLARCTRCGACTEACPHGAIYTYSEDSGIAAGTPVMLPDRRACHMCEGFGCAVACAEGALTAPQESTWRLGEAFVVESRCIAFAGPDCGACANHCPGEIDALALVRGKPRILSEACVGCGLCIDVCPTLPAAIELLPLEADSRRWSALSVHDTENDTENYTENYTENDSENYTENYTEY